MGYTVIYLRLQRVYSIEKYPSYNVHTLDALIFFLVNDFLSIGFHVFALFGIFSGLKASKQLIKVNAK